MSFNPMIVYKADDDNETNGVGDGEVKDHDDDNVRAIPKSRELKPFGGTCLQNTCIAVNI